MQGIVPPHVMLPPGRLVQLLQQALQTQLEACAPYTNAPVAAISLFSDYRASLAHLPTACTQARP